MYRKIWHKPLHQRKVWKKMSLLSKIIYYMQPFIEHLMETWLQPLPFPTILKILCSCVLVLFILLPIIYPAVVFIWTYVIFQYIMERHWGFDFPDRLDMLNYFQHLINFNITNEKYRLFLMLYIERWRIVGTAIASSIDYIRLALCLLFDVIE